jgi:hypothetical protein
VAPDHRWRASVGNRVRGTGWPACSGQPVSVTNNLARHSKVAAQFDVAANGGLTPDQVVAGTNRKLWWICSVAPDHRWEASGDNRLQGRGCPSCAVVAVSIREVRLAAVFPGPDVEDRRVVLPDGQALQADILDREHRLVVEYDGRYWHAGEDKELSDRDKTARLTGISYTVIQVAGVAAGADQRRRCACGEEDPIRQVVAADVLARIAALRPDILSTADAAAYRRRGRPLGAAQADARLADLRSRFAARTRPAEATDTGADPTPDRTASEAILALW